MNADGRRLRQYCLLSAFICVYLRLFVFCFAIQADPIRGFEPSGYFNEQLRTLRIHDARVVINLPETVDAAKPLRLILYALPNGNSIEWTVGAQREPGLDWHFDIQHIGAQTRLLRAVNQRENIAIAYLEADGKSWPAWRQKHEKANELIRNLVDDTIRAIPCKVDAVTLTGHSGGGSFINGFIDGGNAIPGIIDRIAFLDANYSYDDDKHAAKLLNWINSSPNHRFIVMAYDDRNVELNGKKIVSDTGGTYRATHRLIDRLGKDMQFGQSRLAEFDTFTALNGQVRCLIHPNPHNKILHTTMVGEMSGYLYSVAVDMPEEDHWGSLAGEKQWTRWIQPAPRQKTPATTQQGVGKSILTIPDRPPGAPSGLAFMRSLESLPREKREDQIAKQLISGNVPSFLRDLKTIRCKAVCVDGIERTVEFEVMSDYLAIGSDDDFVRVPMNPYTAQSIADAFGCSLVTRKMVDDIDRAAELQLDPKPLTQDREAVATFIQHHQIIEDQRKGNPPALLICGIKKDVVLTNRLLEKPNRVAIYGWRQKDGKPIQPLTIVHVDWYVDYSHGVRLVQRQIKVNGKPMMIEDVLKDPHLHVLLSDEGALNIIRYGK